MGGSHCVEGENAARVSPPQAAYFQKEDVLIPENGKYNKNERYYNMKEKIKIAYLQETDFELQMKRIVVPYLKTYLKRGTFAGYGGTQIAYYSYVRRRAGGIIVISHGFSEFAEKYQEMVFYFLQAGYSVFVPEHRGHGSSQRKVKNRGKVYEIGRASCRERV